MVELVVRLVFSLAVVLGMLVLLTRFSAKRFRGGSDALVRVLHRQALSRTSAVSVVTVGSRVLVLGTTDHQVQLIAELEPEEIEVAVPTVSPHPTHNAVRSARAADGALAGSLLSTQTWKQALAVATSRARDAS